MPIDTEVGTGETGPFRDHARFDEAVGLAGRKQQRLTFVS